MQQHPGTSIGRTLLAVLVAPLAAPLCVFIYVLVAAIIVHPMIPEETPIGPKIDAAASVALVVALFTVAISYLLTTTIGLVVHLLLLWAGKANLLTYVAASGVGAAVISVLLKSENLKVTDPTSVATWMLLYIPSMAVAASFYFLAYSRAEATTNDEGHENDA